MDPLVECVFCKWKCYCDGRSRDGKAQKKKTGKIWGGNGFFFPEFFCFSQKMKKNKLIMECFILTG